MKLKDLQPLIDKYPDFELGVEASGYDPVDIVFEQDIYAEPIDKNGLRLEEFIEEPCYYCQKDTNECKDCSIINKPDYFKPYMIGLFCYQGDLSLVKRVKKKDEESTENE
jgi:hypothetical protein